MNGNNKNYSIRPLTENEAKFAEDAKNYNLLFWYMRRHGLDKEEWYDILIDPYLNAVKKYHEYTHLQVYSFSTILCKQLDTAVSHHYRKMNAITRIPASKMYSLDNVIEDGDHFLGHRIDAWLTDRKANVENQVIFKELFDEFYNKCIECEIDWDGTCAWEGGINGYLKCELDLLLEGYTLYQVNRKTEKHYPYGYTVRDLESDIRRFRRVFKEVFGI